MNSGLLIGFTGRAAVCPKCGSAAVYTTFAVLYSYDHEYRVLSQAQLMEPADTAWHGCKTCDHQWVTQQQPASAGPGRVPANVISLEDFKKA